MIKGTMKPPGKDSKMARDKVHVFCSLRLLCSALVPGQALGCDGPQSVIIVTGLANGK